MEILLENGTSLSDLGFIPAMLSEHSPIPATRQLDFAYQHGGGWRPMTGWLWDARTQSLRYPGDRPLHPIAWIILGDERIYIFPSAWVMVMQEDGSFEVARMD